ncbi:MAG: lipid II flippase MurJ, partial [Cyanobacteria bacterium J06639_18]
SIATGLASGGTLRLTQQFLGTEGLIIQLLQLSISSAVGLVVFAIVVSQMKLPEVNVFVGKLRQKFLKR